MQELTLQIQKFKKLSLKEQYQKLMGILDELRNIQIFNSLFVMLDKNKNLVKSSLLSSIYSLIMKIGSKLEYKSLLKDYSQIENLVEEYKNMEELLELEKIKKEIKKLTK